MRPRYGGEFSRRVFLGGCAFPLLLSQERAKYSVDVKLVDVIATVRNSRREIVRGLRKDDFLLEEDGRPQEIRYFSEESDLPLTLGLLVDTSASQWGIRQTERTAALDFFNRILRDRKDVAFVMRFDRGVEVLGGPTSARDQLESALARLDASDTPQWTAEHPLAPPGFRFGATRLFDAIVEASRRLEPRKGRKALLALSDGVDNASAKDADSAIEAAQRADALVYSVLFSDPHAYSGQRGDPRKRGREALERLSRETGGSHFHFANVNSLNRIFRQVQQEIRNEYSLGYVSDRGAGSGYRRIRLTTRRAGMTVQARDGYYS